MAKQDWLLKDYRYQAYATHGILDGTVPWIQEPALVLSQAEVEPTERERDGFLTLTEVMDLKMDPEVVTLTSCSTGLGRNLTGEEVMGMGRAFQYAGGRNVLMSLWSVQEESANRLTEQFLTFVHEGAAPLEALRRARQGIREEGYEHPFYWAPFILVGG